MMRKQEDKQHRFVYVNLEEFVPKQHLLRKIEEVVNFSFIYKKVEHLYSQVGRKSIDPVVLLKMLLIGYLYNIDSERRLEEEVKYNLAYRWFLGLDLEDSVPDHSTFSQNRRRRFQDSAVFQDIFDHIIKLCIEAGLVTGEVMVTDSTHIKAYASSGRAEVVTVTKTPSEYIQGLHEEAKKIEEELKEKRQGKAKRGRKKSEDSPVREVKRSVTDSDAGLLGRPSKPKGFHYLAHTTVDTAYGIITDIHVTQGNLNDHEPYVKRLAMQQEKFGIQIQQAGADRGYDVCYVHKQLEDLGITGYISSKKQEKEPNEFIYQAETDTFLCPFQKSLQLTHLNWRKDRQQYFKVYAAKTEDCRECPFRADCLSKTAKYKQLAKPLFHEYGLANQVRNETEEYKKIRQLRNVWSEGSFGTLKQCHTLAKTYFRGISKNQMRCLFSALALNLKRMVNVLS